MITIREYQRQDAAAAMDIWNEVVREGEAFPQVEELAPDEAHGFFASQSYTAVAWDSDTAEVVGLNVGRCGHICNTSYAVRSDRRGQHIGEQLVKDSLAMGARLGFRILQFNAVVAANVHALHLYERLGFTRLGRIPRGFLMRDGHYEDIILLYIQL